MKINVNNQQVNGQQVNNNGSQHVQLGGMAFYDESKCFLFAPNEHGAGKKVPGFRSQGVASSFRMVLLISWLNHESARSRN